MKQRPAVIDSVDHLNMHHLQPSDLIATAKLWIRKPAKHYHTFTWPIYFSFHFFLTSRGLHECVNNCRNCQSKKRKQKRTLFCSPGQLNHQKIHKILSLTPFLYPSLPSGEAFDVKFLLFPVSLLLSLFCRKWPSIVALSLLLFFLAMSKFEFFFLLIFYSILFPKSLFALSYK